MIDAFYENSEIFITGGSGVVGKAAIEKLLRSCNVKRVYVLLRCKKGVRAADRLTAMKKSKIFKVLKERKPNELDKLVAIAGNIVLDGLGISPEDKEMMKNVSIIFHSAASTRFDEPLKSAIRSNMKSTLECLKLAETMKNLKIFVHVSTFFSNPYLKLIEDKVYPTVFDWKTAMKLLDDDNLDEDVNTITNKVIQGFPNTYIFTKHLAEEIVNEYRFKLPVVIYKPSIVISAIAEPEPGFSETMTGIMGMITIWGTGLLQALHVNDLKIHLDFTPLDWGTKALLMFTALKGQLPRERFIEATPVGKFSSSHITPTNLKDFCRALTESLYKFPYEKSIWIPNVTVTSSLVLYFLIIVFLQLLPAVLMDGVLKLLGKKPFMMQIQRKAFLTRKVLDFFLLNEYRNDGITDLEEMLRIGDGTEFNLQSAMEYQSYETLSTAIDDIAAGCRKFLLDEPESSIEQCQRILKMKKCAYNVFRGFVVVFFVRAIILAAMASYVV